MKTRYPILLVHGLGMKDVLFVKSWGRIDRFLLEQGYTVYKSRVDAFGTVEGNAEQLREEVLAILRETGAEKVNIIAHSKGGLDAKHMIQALGMAPQVASLTTLCTPHKGSPIASFIMGFPVPAVRVVAFFVDTAYRILGDRHPDSFTVCEELKRTENLETEALNVADGVLCQSFSSSVHPGRWHFVTGIPLTFSRLIDRGRVTDGLVPRDSAVFGHYRGDCVDESTSHDEIVDFMSLTHGKKREKLFAFYAALCGELAQAGL